MCGRVEFPNFLQDSGLRQSSSDLGTHEISVSNSVVIILLFCQDCGKNEGNRLADLKVLPLLRSYDSVIVAKGRESLL